MVAVEAVEEGAAQPPAMTEAAGAGVLPFTDRLVLVRFAFVPS
jgi:hypothetical protein